MTTTPSDQPLEILLVEDDPADARLTQETLNGSTHRLNITVAEDGEIAMARLRKEGEYASGPRPDLILLDLRLPNKSGEEVLDEMNEDPDLVTIPVMILTATEAEQSLLASYNIPPSRYCRKPLDLTRFHQAIGQLGLFGREPIRITRTETATASPTEGASKGKWWWPFG